MKNPVIKQVCACGERGLHSHRWGVINTWEAVRIKYDSFSLFSPMIAGGVNWGINRGPTLPCLGRGIRLVSIFVNVSLPA